MPALLTGANDLGSYKRSRCAAGHKAMWHASWGGYPPAAFLDKLSPRLSALAASLGTETYTAETVSGSFAPSGRRGSDCRRTSSYRSEPSTPTSARSAATWRPARC